MLDITSATVLVEFLKIHGYWFLLVLMILEGPMITYIASFCAAMGFFNIYLIWIISILGNQLPDLGYYLLGRNMRFKTIDKILLFLRLTPKKIRWLEKHLKNHAIKTIIIIKLVPIFPGAGLFLTGFMKVPFKKFFKASFTVDFIACTTITILGFYSGIAINEMSKIFKTTTFIIPLGIILIVIFYFVLKIVTKKIAGNKKVNIKRPE